MAENPVQGASDKKPFPEETGNTDLVSPSPAPDPASSPSSIPKYLWALGILAVLAMAATVFISMNPLSPPANTPPGAGTIEGILLYSPDCTICRQQNTFELVLIGNGISYEKTLLPVSTGEGARLAEEIGVEVLPTLLLKVEDVLPSHVISLKNGVTVTLPEFLSPYRLGDWYGIGEVQVADNLAPRMFLDSVDPACSVEDGMVRVDEFADYLDKDSFDARTVIRSLKNQTFQGEINHVFHNNIINDPASEYVARAAECVRGQSGDAFSRFNASFYERYFDNREFQRAIGSDLLPSRFIKDQNFLDQKLEEIIGNIGGVDVAVYRNCVQNIPEDSNATQTGAQERLLMDAQLVKGYSLKPILPQYIIDCRYTVAGYEQLESSICALRPDLSGCQPA